MKDQYNKKQVYYPLKRRITVIIFIFICMSVLTLYGDSADIDPAFASTILSINEFMADNYSTVEDPHEPGSFEDWIEIYNPGSASVNMAGMYLTDDLTKPTLWKIPGGVTIPAKGYLLFWADNDEKQGPTHTNFKLSLDGESIGLFGSDGVTMIDSIEFGPQIIDVSYGRYPNGGADWGFMATSPSASNSIHNAPPAITGTSHTPVSPADGESVWVTCSVTDEGSIVDVNLIYNKGTGEVTIRMHDDGVHNDGGINDNLFGVKIPGFSKNTVVKYYISAIDDLGAVSLDPGTAPAIGHSYIVAYVPPVLFINEFMADNGSTTEVPLKPGSFEDWIEIYNPGNAAVNMGGLYLTDDLTMPTQWKIPSGASIPAKGYLLFWADNDEGIGTTHTNFKLSLDGENIGLFGADGITVIDSIKFGAQITDISYGRYPDGAGEWGFMTPTPGVINGNHNNPPAITGIDCTPKLPGEDDSVWVTCSVTDEETLLDVNLTYDPGTGPINIKMYDDGVHNDGGGNDNLFGAGIPAFAKNTIIKYYVTATDNHGVASQDPVNLSTGIYLYVVGYVPPMLFINEFMASNDSTIENPEQAGNFADWIEIYNAGDVALDMGGMYLTDDLSNPIQWEIPENVSIPAKGYLFFWADGNKELGIMHTGFKLSKSGGEIALFNTTAKGNILIDKVSFGEQASDVSYSRIYDYGTPWVFTENFTPGYTNYFHEGTYVYNFSYIIDSYAVIQESEADINVSRGYNPSSGKWETSYILWGKPAGDNFSLNPGNNYIISISK